jgi:hypothetical protein
MTPPRLANERVPLYRRVLGEAWDSLPEPLRAMHDLDGERGADGVAVVERGSGLLARLVALVIGLPPAGADFRSRSPFAPGRGANTGNAISPAACSRACSSKGVGASNACCANGSDHSISA